MTLFVTRSFGRSGEQMAATHGAECDCGVVAGHQQEGPARGFALLGARRLGRRCTLG